MTGEDAHTVVDRLVCLLVDCSKSPSGATAILAIGNPDITATLF
ncbi:hypothetical protein ACRAKJ_20120 [Saccharothrix sp. DSM 118769]